MNRHHKYVNIFTGGRIVFAFALVFRFLFSANAAAATIQFRCEEGVRKYVNERFSTNYKYVSHSFGTVEVIVAPAVMHLEELKAARDSLALLRPHYPPTKFDSLKTELDTLIDRQKRMIKEKNIRDNYKIRHLFSLSDSTGHTIMECRFYLSANFVVKDLQMLLQTKLNDDYFNWFGFYINQRTIYLGESNLAIEKSNEFYTFFNERFETYDGDRGLLLRSALIALKVTRQKNKYDVVEIVQMVAREYLTETKAGYVPGIFSKVEAITDDKSNVLGYRVFHKFISNLPDKNTQCLYFEFDPWFVIAGTLVVDAPFDKYFAE